MTNSKSLSIIVPCYRENDQLPRCLAAIQQAITPEVEVLVVCDGGDFEWAARIAKEHGAVSLHQETNKGPGAARNLGAQHASAELLLFLDSDVIMAPDVIERVLAAFSQDPGLTGLMGSYDDAPDDPGFFSQFKNLQHHYVHQKGGEEAFTFWGACGAIRRDAFLAIGGFDERFDRPSIEDIELGYRLTAAGHRLALRREIQVKHLKRWTACSMAKTDLFCRAIPWARLLMSYGSMKRDLNLKGSAQASVALSYLLLLGLGVAILYPMSLGGSAICATGLLVLNRDFYSFLLRKRGFGFLLRAIPVHWFYYLYCGVGYVSAMAMRLTGRPFTLEDPPRLQVADSQLTDDLA